jgi:Asp/Glu/hydantoin racemase
MVSYKYKILLINPNSSEEMTENLKPLISRYPTKMAIDTFTAPTSAPKSINNETDALDSANVVLPEILQYIKEKKYDGYLVACYSLHPLVEMIRDIVPRGVYVTGIFEASIMTALTLTPTPRDQAVTKHKTRFGIVTTGTAWEAALSEGVLRVLGLDTLAQAKRFKGVESTGLNADELHTAPKELVTKKMNEATKRLVRGRDVKVISLGCAGMSGLDEIVTEALIEELGEKESREIFVLDPVKAGLGILENLLRSLPTQG